MTNFTPAEIILFIVWLGLLIVYLRIIVRYKCCLKLLQASMEVLEEKNLFGEAMKKACDDDKYNKMGCKKGQEDA